MHASKNLLQNHECLVGGGGALILFVEFNYIHVASENILESEEQQCICKKQYSPFDLRNIIW